MTASLGQQALLSTFGSVHEGVVALWVYACKYLTRLLAMKLFSVFLALSVVCDILSGSIKASLCTPEGGARK
jgi:hypothetical protein